MTRLALLYLATTVMSGLCAIVLAISLIQEAKRSSAYSEQSYRNGLRDGEIFVRCQILRAEAELELIEERQARIAKERL